MPISVDALKEIFCGDDVLLLPLVFEFRPDNLEVLFKLDLIFLVFEKEPDEDKFLVEILSWFEDFDFSTFLGFEIFHIQDVGDECIGHLPRGIDLNKVCKVVVDRGEKFVLNGGLILLECFAGN